MNYIALVVTVVTVVTVAIAGLDSSRSTACELLDQSCETSQSSMYCVTTRDEYGHRPTQSFTPEASDICGVELHLDSPTPGGGTATVYVQTSPDPGQGIIATGKAMVEYGPRVWVRFDFPVTPLVPGSTYYLHAVANNGTVFWCTDDPYVSEGCQYEGGQAYDFGEPQDFDWFFRTYTTGPTPVVDRTWGAVKSIYDDR